MMDKDLLIARAHGELHKTLFKELFLMMFQIQSELNRNLDSADSDAAPRPTHKSRLIALNGQVERTIRETSFPLQPENADEIRQMELLLARQFLQEMSDLLPENKKEQG